MRSAASASRGRFDDELAEAGGDRLVELEVALARAGEARAPGAQPAAIARRNSPIDETSRPSTRPASQARSAGFGFALAAKLSAKRPPKACAKLGDAGLRSRR